MSVLKPGALVQHEDGGTGTVVDSVIGWAVRKHDGSGSFCWSGALEDHGWSLVGSGFAPEGARLAWVTDGFDAAIRCSHEVHPTRAIDALELLTHSYTSLNPAQGDT